MTHPVLLSNTEHKDLRVITTRGAQYGDQVMTAFVFPREFRNLQAHYPIVFHKTDDGAFRPLALFGFQDSENLFLGPSGWDAAYIPLTLQHQPFLIGQSNGEMVLHIDLKSPRISYTEGESVFLPYGGNSEFLDRVVSVLAAIHEGVQAAPSFSNALLAHRLLESFVFDVELGDGSQHRMSGFYAINEERVNALNGVALESLQRAGHLQAIYMAIASLSQLRALAERKVKSHAAAGA